MNKGSSNVHLFNKKDDFFKNNYPNTINIALEEEIYKKNNDVEFPLEGESSQQKEAILKADEIYRSIGGKVKKQFDGIPWYDILAPQIILYFLSKIIRAQSLLERINKQFPGSKIMHTSNPLMEAFGLDTPIFFKQVVSKFVLKDRLRSYFLKHVPGILRLYHCGNLLMNSKKGTFSTPSLPNDCQTLIWCENRVHEMAGFAVADKLAELGKKVTCIVGRDLHREDSVNISQFRDKQWLKTINKLAKDFKRTLYFISNQLISELSFTSESERYEYVRNFLYREFLHWYMPQAIDVLASSINILDRLKPKVVLIQDIADFRTRTLSFLAQERKISVVHQQFGDQGKANIELRWGCADIYGLWGSWYKDIVVNHGINEKKIQITGTPKISDKSQLCINTIVYLSSKKKRILFPLVPASPLTFGNGGALSFRQCQITLQTLFNWAVNTNGSVELIIKPRPLQDDNWAIPLLKEIPDNVKVLQADMPIKDALKNTDVVITTHSTVAIDSILTGIPLVIIDLFKSHLMNRYIKEGVAVGVYNLKDLESTMDKILNDSITREKMIERQKCCREHIVAFGFKQSVEKIEEILARLI